MDLSYYTTTTTTTTFSNITLNWTNITDDINILFMNDTNGTNGTNNTGAYSLLRRLLL